MKLCRICSQITDGKHGDCRDKPHSGFYFLSAKDVFERTLNYENVREIEEDDFKDTHRRTNLEPGDLLVTNSGTIGRVSIAQEDPRTRCTTFQKSVAILKPIRKFVDPFFLYYILVNKRPEIQDIAGGTTQQNLLLKDLREIDIPLPSLLEQRTIASILSSFDDKIELNRRTNATVEDITHLHFQKFIQEEVGKETTIGEAVTVVGGSTPSTSNPAFWVGGNIHWTTPKDLASLQSPILLDTDSKITELGLNQISSGLLPIGTVLLSSRAPIGYLAITQIPVAINQGFIAIRCTDEVPNYFILNWLKAHMEEIIGRANGTTFLEISKSNFRPMKIILPAPENMKAFVAIVEPLYKKIVSNLRVNRILATLRDALLPRLMRGEVKLTAPEEA